MNNLIYLIEIFVLISLSGTVGVFQKVAWWFLSMYLVNLGLHVQPELA